MASKQGSADRKKKRLEFLKKMIEEARKEILLCESCIEIRRIKAKLLTYIEEADKLSKAILLLLLFIPAAAQAQSYYPFPQYGRSEGRIIIGPIDVTPGLGVDGGGLFYRKEMQGSQAWVEMPLDKWDGWFPRRHEDTPKKDAFEDKALEDFLDIERKRR